MFFWLAILVTFVLVGSIMTWLLLHARHVPDKEEYHTRRRLNPDQLRLLAYVLFILVCLVAAVYELSFYDDIPADDPIEAEKKAAVERLRK